MNGHLCRLHSIQNCILLTCFHDFMTTKLALDSKILKALENGVFVGRLGGPIGCPTVRFNYLRQSS